MEIAKYFDAEKFLSDNHRFLFENEAANNLIIGIANRLTRVEKKEDVLMCSITDRDDVLLCVVMTPPRDLIVASKEVNELAIILLVNDLVEQGISLPGIMAESTFANLFCEKWKEKTGNEPKLFRRERAYQLSACNKIKTSDGQMRVADKNDMDQIAEWIADFHSEIDEPITPEATKKISEEKITNKNIFVWVDGKIVSMCAWDRESIIATDLIRYQFHRSNSIPLAPM